MYGWMYDEYDKLKSKSKSNEEDEKQNDTTYPSKALNIPVNLNLNGQSILNNKYIVKKLIGKGTFANVFKVTTKISNHHNKQSAHFHDDDDDEKSMYIHFTYIYVVQ